MKMPASRRRLALLLVAVACCSSAKGLPLVPFPEDATISVVGEQLEVYGLPLMAYEFHSPESVERVATFYKAIWQANAGDADADQPFLEKELGGWKVLSRLELGHNITVQLKAAGVRGTQVLVGVSPLPTLLQRGGRNRVDINIPLLTGTRLTSLVASVDRGSSSEVYWLISDASVDGFLAGYRDQHEQRGDSVKGFRVVRDEAERAIAGTLNVASVRGHYRYDVMQSRDGKTRVTAIWRAH